MIVPDAHIIADLPPASPLQMPQQDFGKSPRSRKVTQGGHPIWRLSVFIPALIGTALLMWGLHGVLMQSGMTSLEWVLLSLIGATFIWVTMAVSTVGVGLAARLREGRGDAGPSNESLNVALLVPIYNEVPSDVFGNAKAMLDDLVKRRSAHNFTLFVLSDTTNDETALQEWQAFQSLKARTPKGIEVYYRRRAQNTDKKVGNLVDWITGWGGSYDAMLVLDADSLMTGRAILRLSDELAADPDAGLIQSFPQLIGAETVFARIQQFSNIAYGWLLAEGLARWAQHEGNYWGHNAIIRTRAFAAAAGLPHMKGLMGGSQLILSHDFVEASLLRRAGWRVRFLPRVTGSFEETPGTLIDYVVRDRRWCRGNLQHLRLLSTRGLHPISRFHMFQGAAAYLMSPAWFVLLVFWALLGRDAETNVIKYFNETNPLFPNWPPEMSHIDSTVFLFIMYAMLLTPKLAGAGIIATNGKVVRLFGGRLAFFTAFLVEVGLSILYAPIMMVQQTRAVLRALFGRSEGWTPQQRDARAYPLRTLVSFHWMETLFGLMLVIGLFAGLISLWLLPIIFSLVLAIPLSALSAVPLGRAPAGLRMDSPNSLREPAILTKAKHEREVLRATVTNKASLPAE
jgi:membrane glycosyltransferase